MRTMEESLEWANRIVKREDLVERIAKLDFEVRNAREEVEILRSRANTGLVVSILGHQFEANASRISNHLDRLATQNPPNPNTVQYLTEAVNEMMMYIRNMSPLYNKYRNYELITGEYIVNYVKQFYNNSDKLEFRGFESFEVRADTTKILPSIINIIRNALYWGPQGKLGSSKVLINVVNSHTIDITDCGNGVHEEYIPYLFKLGFTRSMRGQGIGLYLAKLNMVSMGGDLTYSKDIEYWMGGATFTLKFRGSESNGN